MHKFHSGSFHGFFTSEETYGMWHRWWRTLRGGDAPATWPSFRRQTK